MNPDLGARQAALVAALVADGPVPDGFDPQRLAVARRAMVRKRAAEAAAAWPLLAASLGPDWGATFAASVAGRPPGGPLPDGWDLARALSAAGALGSAAAVELAEREVALRYDGVGAPRRRRLPAVRRCGRVLVVQFCGRVTRGPLSIPQPFTGAAS